MNNLLREAQEELSGDEHQLSDAVENAVRSLQLEDESNAIGDVSPRNGRNSRLFLTRIFLVVDM